MIHDGIIWYNTASTVLVTCYNRIIDCCCLYLPSILDFLYILKYCNELISICYTVCKVIITGVLMHSGSGWINSNVTYGTGSVASIGSTVIIRVIFWDRNAFPNRNQSWSLHGILFYFYPSPGELLRPLISRLSLSPPLIILYLLFLSLFILFLYILIPSSGSCVPPLFPKPSRFPQPKRDYIRRWTPFKPPPSREIRHASFRLVFYLV